MKNIIEEQAGWPEVPLLTTRDLVLGGEDGPSNYQAKALVSRVNKLKEDTELDGDSSLVPIAGWDAVPKLKGEGKNAQPQALVNRTAFLAGPQGASKVGYTPEGTGAVATNVQAKLRETVSVKDFGADPSASVAINTAAIQAAINAANSVYIPAGDYKINGTLIIPSNRTIYGDGARVSVLTQTTNNSALKASYAGTASRNQKINLRGFSVLGYAAMTATLVDMRNTSYLLMDDLLCDGDPTGASKAGGIIIDNTRGDALFNGYVVLRDVFALRGTIGYQGEVNQLTILGGFYNSNSVRGIIAKNGANVQIAGSEVSGNGTGVVATYLGKYPSGSYDKGGILLDGINGADIVGVWFEQNADRVQGQYSRNDVEVLSNCRKVSVRQSRFDQSSYLKFHGLAKDQGHTYGNGLGIQDQGTNGLVCNGQFVIADSMTGRPLGWYSTGSTITYSEPLLLPSGVGGVRLEGSSGVSRLGQVILTHAQCQKLVGKKVTATFWAAAVNASWTGGSARVGLGTDGVDRLTNGSYTVLDASPGAAYKITVTHTITGEEIYGITFLFQFFQATGPWQVELGDVSVSLGDVSWANFDRPVTSLGGDIWTTTDFKIGGARHSYGTNAPTSGRWAQGDIVYNTTPSASGFVGWVCTSAGTPGTWKTFGAISA